MMRRLGRFIWRYLYALAASLYLLTIGQASAKHRSFMYRLISHFGYQPVKTLIPAIPLTEVISRNMVLATHDPLGAGGNVSLLELAVISSVIQRRQPARLMEIGTLDGRTTLNMAANSAPDAKIFTLDLPDQPSGTCFIGNPLAAKITQLIGDSTKFDWSEYNNTLDFVFIDADHTYPFVMSDSRQALKLLRDGRGTIMWHDYATWDWEGTTLALNDLYVEGQAFGYLQHIEGTSLIYLALD
jgi:hypothetical protein